jgi:hypothetical protein
MHRTGPGTVTTYMGFSSRESSSRCRAIAFLNKCWWGAQVQKDRTPEEKHLGILGEILWHRTSLPWLPTCFRHRLSKSFLKGLHALAQCGRCTFFGLLPLRTGLEERPSPFVLAVFKSFP